MKIYMKQADGSFSLIYDEKRKQSKIFIVPNKRNLQTSAHLEFFTKKLSRYIPYISYALESSDLKQPFLNTMELTCQGSEQQWEISVKDQISGEEFPLRPLELSEMERPPLPDSAIEISSDIDFDEAFSGEKRGLEPLSPLSEEEIAEDVALFEKDSESDQVDIESLFEASLSSDSDSDFSAEFFRAYDEKEAESGLGELLAELEADSLKNRSEETEGPQFLDDLDLSVPLEIEESSFQLEDKPVEQSSELAGVEEQEGFDETVRREELAVEELEELPEEGDPFADFDLDSLGGLDSDFAEEAEAKGDLLQNEKARVFDEKQLLKRAAKTAKKAAKEKAKQEKIQEKTYKQDLKAKRRRERKHLPKSILPGVIFLSFLGISSLIAFFLIKYLL